MGGSTAPGETLFSVNGLMNAGTGLWTIGTNPITIGADNDLVVHTASNSITISSSITNHSSGASNLTKSGVNTLTLSGANTYSGATTVKAGTLALDGSGSIDNSTSIVVGNAVLDVSAKSGFIIGSNQTLSGTGTVKVGTGNTLSINGTHAPGNGAGIQTVDGNLAYGSSSIFAWDLNSAAIGTRGDATGAGGYDGVNVSGSLSASTGAKFRVILGSGAFEDTFWNTNQTWNNIFTQADGTTPISFPSGFSKVEWYKGSSDQTNSTSTQGCFTIDGTSLKWTAVPEPSAAFVGLLLGAGLLRRRRSADPLK